MKDKEITAVYPLGPFQVDKKYLYHNYLMQVGDVFILFDLVPLHKWDLLHLAIDKYCKIEDIKYIVLSYMTMSTMNVLIDLIDEGFQGVILTNHAFARQIENAQINIKVIYIDDIKDKFYIGINDYLAFYPMAFVPLPHMFMTYSSVNKAFFSSVLLSSYYYHDASITNLKKNIFLFHKENVPSSEYIKTHLKFIKQSSPNYIYPLFGYIIEKEDIEDIIDYMIQHDFYNTYLFTDKDQIEQKINYQEIINHMLTHLSSYFTKADIYEAFIGSPFHLNQDPIELKKSTLDDFKLYHGFFEYIYTKKGMLWLSILEPIIHVYVKTYHIELPTIFKSKIVQSTIEKEHMIEEKLSIESKMKTMQDEMYRIKEQTLRCPITNLYKQEVLSEMLKDSYNTIKDLKGEILLIQLDQIVDFNHRYGKQIGDESIRNLAYVIEQIKKPHQLLFKHRGPGILLYDQEFSHEQMVEMIKTIRNEIKDSILFIEKSTVTISNVLLSEMNRIEDHEMRIQKFLEILERRMAILSFGVDQKHIQINSDQNEIIDGKILLVDEDEMNRNMLFRIFKRMNFETLLATSVKEALDLVNSYQVDIIISEINLSKIDGFQLKQKLNESEQFQKIPFIMVSHNKTLENIKRGNILDVDLILEKPIIPDELIGHIKRYKERKKH